MDFITPMQAYQQEVYLTDRQACLDNIRARFTENSDGSYDVILEINSNKFLIAIQNVADHIVSLEIIAIKGFVEITNKIIMMIKRLIEHLRYRLD
jgi:hypothetical protein